MKIGFKIENRAGIQVLVYPDESCRPASEEELELWQRVQEAARLLRYAEQVMAKSTTVSARHGAKRIGEFLNYKPHKDTTNE